MSRHEYIDFQVEVELSESRPGNLVVRTISSAGETRDEAPYAFDENKLRDRLHAIELALARSGAPTTRRKQTTDEIAVEEFGRELFDAVFAGNVLVAFNETRNKAKCHDKNVRLKLCISSPELARLPWEFLFHPSMDDFLCLQTDISIARYISQQQSVEPITVELPLQILGIVSNPDDDLDVESESEKLDEVLRELGDNAQVTWRSRVTWDKLQREMVMGRWHVLHFIGHGGFNRRRGEGEIYLMDKEGNQDAIRASTVARLMSGHRTLRLVVLNSCQGAQGSKSDEFSSTTATLVRTGVPAVVGMQFAISDASAKEFSRKFYEYLALTGAVDIAMTTARQAISKSDHCFEWATPVLYLRATNGVLFDVPEQSEGLVKTASQSQPEQSSNAAHARTDRLDTHPTTCLEQSAPSPPVQTEPAPPTEDAEVSAPVEKGEPFYLIARTTMGHGGYPSVKFGRPANADHYPPEAIELAAGYANLGPYLVTNPVEKAHLIERCKVLIWDDRISSAESFVPLLDQVVVQACPLLIIADDFDDEVLEMLTINQVRGVLQSCAVRSTFEKDQLRMLAEMTNGRLFERGQHNLPDVQLSELGSARWVRVTDTTTFIQTTDLHAHNEPEHLANYYNIQFLFSGTGGLGPVWHGIDSTTAENSEVLLWFLPSSLTDNAPAFEEFRARFAELKALRHKAIRPIYGLKQHRSFGCFFVTGVSRGANLHEYRQQTINRFGVFPIESATQLLRPVAEALDYAHCQGVDYIPLTASGIAVSDDGNNVEIADAGIARITRSVLAGTPATATENSAPEITHGGQPAATSDQFELASIAWQLLTGQLPFDAQDETIDPDQSTPNMLPTLNDQSDTVNSAFARGMALNAGERFANCVGFIDALAGHNLKSSKVSKSQSVQTTTTSSAPDGLLEEALNRDTLPSAIADERNPTGTPSTTALECKDFDLVIHWSGDDKVSVEAESPIGEARAEVTISRKKFWQQSVELELASLRSTVPSHRTTTRQHSAAESFGRKIFSWVFAEQVQVLYRKTCESAGRVRIKLRLPDSDLADLPWELLYDPLEGDFVCLSTRTPIVRYVDSPRRIKPLATDLPLRILGMAASPIGFESLDVASEKRLVEEAIAGHGDYIKLEWVAGATPRDLQRSLHSSNAPWHVFHFAGPGDYNTIRDEGVIFLEAEDGTAASYPATNLARQIMDHGHMRLAVLNFSESATVAAVLAMRGLPAVVGMQDLITDSAAIEFSRSFYSSLAYNCDVIVAMSEARKAIVDLDSDSLEWAIPVLYLRSSDGVLFDPRP